MSLTQAQLNAIRLGDWVEVTGRWKQIDTLRGSDGLQYVGYKGELNMFSPAHITAHRTRDEHERILAEESKPKLKPCPFCGSADVRLFGKNRAWVRCMDCGCEADTSMDHNAAIAAWNHRTPEVPGLVVSDIKTRMPYNGFFDVEFKLNGHNCTRTLLFGREPAEAFAAKLRKHEVQNDHRKM